MDSGLETTRPISARLDAVGAPASMQVLASSSSKDCVVLCSNMDQTHGPKRLSRADQRLLYHARLRYGCGRPGEWEFMKLWVGPGKQRPQGSRHVIPFSPQPAPGRARGVARRRLPSGEDQSALIRAMSALVVKSQLTFPFPSQLFSEKAQQLQFASPPQSTTSAEPFIRN